MGSQSIAMKQLSFIPLALALAALLGYAILRAIHFHPHTHEMILALIPSLVAGTVAVVPALRQRIYGQAAVVQSAFYGMIIHLAGTLLLGVVVFFAAGVHEANTDPFALWVMWFFWASLTAAAFALIRLIRATPVAGSVAEPVAGTPR